MRRAFLGLLAVVLAAPTVSAQGARHFDSARARGVARELETVTRRIADAVVEERHHYDEAEETALRRMEELADRARFYRRQLDAFPDQPARTRDDFDALVSAYVRASAAMNDLHAYSGIPQDFRQVERLMDELTDVHGGRERYWGAYGNDRPAGVTVPAGVILGVHLTSPLRSRDLRAGDELDASLSEDVVVGSRVVAPRGSPATIRVVEMDDAGRVEGRERLTLELVTVRMNARDYPVETEDVTFEAEGSKKRDIGTIVGSAAVGAILGAIIDDEEGEGATKGAAAGAAAGTGVVLMTKGKTVRLPAGQLIRFRLEEPVRVRQTSPVIRDSEDASPGHVSRRRY